MKKIITSEYALVWIIKEFEQNIYLNEKNKMLNKIQEKKSKIYIVIIKTIINIVSIIFILSLMILIMLFKKLELDSFFIFIKQSCFLKIKNEIKFKQCVKNVYMNKKLQKSIGIDKYHILNDGGDNCFTVKKKIINYCIGVSNEK